MIPIILLSFCIALLLLLYLRVKPPIRRVGPFLPDSMLFGVGLYTAGALAVFISDGSPGSIDVAMMSLVAMVSALVGATLFALVCGRFYERVSFRDQFSKPGPRPMEIFAIRVMLVVSGLVCIAFVYAVFSNARVGALLGIASLSGDMAFLEARKAITAGSEGYLAPGYVKQFRDILVPVAVIALMAVTPCYRRSSAMWFGLGTALVAMLVSGQRLVIVVLFLAVLLAHYYTRRFPSRRPGGFVRLPWLVFVVVVAAYGALSVLLGRVDQEQGAFQVAANVAINFTDRVFFAAPRENVLTYPVWQALGPTWGGSWIADLGGVLPGVRESLANVLHSATGGSLQGNSPLGLAPDVWLAWGWVGLAIVPFCFAFAVGLLDMVLLSGRSTILFATRIYLFVILPICYSPYLFVLYGGAVALMLIVLSAILRSGDWWRLSVSNS